MITYDIQKLYLITFFDKLSKIFLDIKFFFNFFYFFTVNFVYIIHHIFSFIITTFTRNIITFIAIENFTIND